MFAEELIREVLELAMRAAVLAEPPGLGFAWLPQFDAPGFPDDSFPANAVISRRKSVDEAAVFVGFDD